MMLVALGSPTAKLEESGFGDVPCGGRRRTMDWDVALDAWQLLTAYEVPGPYEVPYPRCILRL